MGKFQYNWWGFIAIYAVLSLYLLFMLFCRKIFATIYALSCGEKMSPKVQLWRKMTNIRSGMCLGPSEHLGNSSFSLVCHKIRALSWPSPRSPISSSLLCFLSEHCICIEFLISYFSGYPMCREHCRLSICEYWLSWTNTVSAAKIQITFLILNEDSVYLCVTMAIDNQVCISADANVCHKQIHGNRVSLEKADNQSPLGSLSVLFQKLTVFNIIHP